MPRTYRLFLNSGQWKRMRAQYRRKHPLCERCSAKGLAVLAQEVHHKQTCGDDPHLQTSWQNLESICSACHAEHHAPEKAKMLRGYSNETDAEGYFVDEQHPSNRARRNKDQTQG